MAGQGLACMRQIPAPWKRPRPAQIRCTVFLMDTLISFQTSWWGIISFMMAGQDLACMRQVPMPCQIFRPSQIRCIALSHVFLNLFFSYFPLNDALMFIWFIICIAPAFDSNSSHHWCWSRGTGDGKHPSLNFFWLLLIRDTTFCRKCSDAWFEAIKARAQCVCT